MLRLKHYSFVDYATQGYVLLVGLIILVFHGARLSNWPWLLLIQAVILPLVHGLIQLAARRPANRPIGFLREFYPVPLYIWFYRETEFLNQMTSVGYLDAYFLRAEKGLLGWQPGLELMLRFPARWLAEVMYAAYCSFYFMIAGIGLALLLRDRRQFRHFIAVISFVLYVCYAIYIFLPVVGPRIVDLHLAGVVLPPEALPHGSLAVPESVRGAIWYQIMAWVYEHFESAGAAFPSSHVAVALGTLYFSFRYLRRIRYLHLLAVILLCVSTVYGRYHYVVDVIGGMVTAALLLPLGNWLYFQFGNQSPSPSAASRTNQTSRS